MNRLYYKRLIQLFWMRVAACLPHQVRYAAILHEAAENFDCAEAMDSMPVTALLALSALRKAKHDESKRSRGSAS